MESIAEAMGEQRNEIRQLREELKRNSRTRNIALVTALLCLIAAAFSAGYALTSRKQLSEQIETNKAVVCANARSTALAFREPQVSANGDRETHEHYVERLVAQREILLAASHLSCPSIKGFDTFPYLRGRALAEIDRILQREAPKRFQQLDPTAKVSAKVNQAIGTTSPPSTASQGANSPAVPTAAAPGSNPASTGGDGPSPAKSSPPTSSPSTPKHESSPAPSGPKKKPTPPKTGSDPSPAPPSSGSGPAPAPPPATEAPTATPTPTPTPTPAAPGLIENPGGLVGETVCALPVSGICSG